MLPRAVQRAIDHAGAKEQVGDERDTSKMGSRQRSILGQIAVIRVASRPGARTRGWLAIGSLRIPVPLGRSGYAATKGEGDGATTRGSFRLVRLWWRADRLPHPRTRLPVRRIGRSGARIGEPGGRRDNTTRERSERLWRMDNLYDLIIELAHNPRPRVAGRGSAVFIHVARPGFGSTAGCVALERKRLSWLLSRVGPKTRIMIQ